MGDPYFTSGTNGGSHAASGTTLESKYPQLLALFTRIQFDYAQTFYNDFACKEYEKDKYGRVKSDKISEADVLKNMDRLPRFKLINRNIVNSAEWKLSVQYMSNHDEMIVVAQWFATLVDREVSDAVERCNYFNDIASLDLDRSIFDRIVPHKERSDSISISYEQFQDVARDKLYWELWRKLSNAGIFKSSETSPSIEKRILPVSFDVSNRSAVFKERYAPLISKDGTTMTLAAWHAVWLLQKSLNSIGIQTPQQLKEFSGNLAITLRTADLFNANLGWMIRIRPRAKK